MKRGQLLESVGAVITGVILVAVGIMIVQTMHDVPLENYTISNVTLENTTKLTASGSHNYTLSRIATDYDGKLVVVYEYKSASNVSIDGTKLGSLDGTSPDTFTVPKALLKEHVSVQYSLGSGTNITKSNLTYAQYSGCTYSYDACENIKTTYDLANTAYTILPIVILITAAVAIIGAVLLLQK